MTDARARWMNELPSLDPRTVARRILLETSGARRPAVSVVLAARDLDADTVRAIGALGRPEPSLQMVVVSEPPDDVPVSAVRTRLAAAPSLSVVGISAAPAEGPVEVLNRAVWVAVGEVVVLRPDLASRSADWIGALARRFREEPGLGVVECGSRPGPPADSAAVPRGRAFPEASVAIRGDLLEALGGFDESYATPVWGLRDLCMRSRAIGFTAPRRLRGRAPGAPRAGDAADRSLFAHRARSAPDRSVLRPTQSTEEIGPPEVAVYTTVTDRYSQLKPQPRQAVGGARLVAFLDAATSAEQKARPRGWTIVSGDFPDTDARRASRFYKANAHLAAPEARVSLWVDASIVIVCPFSVARLAKLFLAERDICVFRHYARRTVYEEAEACKREGHDRAEIIDGQMARYRREGLPHATGLAELPVILRRHSPAVREFNEAWWSEIRAGSWRDQLSFDYVAWKLGVSYSTFPLTVTTRNGMFLKYPR